MKKWIPLLLLTITMSCEDEAAIRENKIAEEVQLRIEEFQRIREEQCHERIQEKAIKAADSIMLLEAFLDAPDSLKVLDKKERPEVPQIEFPDFEKPVPPKSDSIASDTTKVDTIR